MSGNNFFSISLLKTMFNAFLINIGIAIILFVIFENASFKNQFITTQFMGLNICFFIYVSEFLLQKFYSEKFNKTWIFMRFITDIIGVFIGIISGAIMFILYFKQASFINIDIEMIKGLVYGGMLFGGIVCYIAGSHLYYAGKIDFAEKKIDKEKIKRISSERNAFETKLKLLEAQIEPHFLFNTLTNILELMDTNVDKSKNMLMDLSCFLRSSVSRIKKGRNTLRDEINIIQAYLNIFKVRMGVRLTFNINITDEIMDMSFPSMLIQPLVENCIKHGLGKKLNGGEILVNGKKEDDIVVIEIIDNGDGMRENFLPGMGLKNVMERIDLLFGDKGRLILNKNLPQGLKAIIQIPYEKRKKNNSNNSG